jgi:hypothetical protein
VNGIIFTNTYKQKFHLQMVSMSIEQAITSAKQKLEALEKAERQLRKAIGSELKAVQEGRLMLSAVTPYGKKLEQLQLEILSQGSWIRRLQTAKERGESLEDATRPIIMWKKKQMAAARRRRRR